MIDDIFNPEEQAIVDEIYGPQGLQDTEVPPETDEAAPVGGEGEVPPPVDAQTAQADSAPTLAEMLAQQREAEAGRAAREEKMYDLLNRMASPQPQETPKSEEDIQMEAALAPYLNPMREELERQKQINRQLMEEREAARGREFENSINSAVDTVKAAHPDFDPLVAGQYLANEIQKLVNLGAPYEHARTIVLKTQGADPDVMSRIWMAHKAKTAPIQVPVEKPAPDEHIPQPGSSSVARNYRDMLTGDRDAQAEAIGEMFK